MHWRNAISLIMRITYGYAMQENDPLVAVMEESIRIMNFGAVPGRWLVDAVPLRESSVTCFHAFSLLAVLYVPSWFPGAGWKRLGEQWREQIDALFWKPFAWTKDRVVSLSTIYQYQAHANSRRMGPQNHPSLRRICKRAPISPSRPSSSVHRHCTLEEQIP